MRFRNSWVKAEVMDVQQVATDVKQIEMMPEIGVQPFTAGSHIDVSVLINELPEVRSYSLVGQYQQEKPYTIAVKLLESSRGGSAYMWKLEKGNQLKISAPVNHFELSYGDFDYLLVAGGIGITPLIGMVEELKKRGVRVKMVYLGKHEDQMPYLDQLCSMLAEDLIIHKSTIDGRFDLSQLDSLITPKTLLYLCGPMVLSSAVRRIWETTGRERHKLRFETFGASGLFATQDFKVRIPRFKKEITVAENQTLLQALTQANVDIMYDCQKGECGLCQVDVLECTGSLDHRDCFFDENEKAENKKMCACVSRVVNGDLTIETAYRGMKSG